MYLKKVHFVPFNLLLVVQNSGDYKHLSQVFGLKKKLHFEIIEGCIYEAVEETLGYVGRIRKDNVILCPNSSFVTTSK